MNSRRRLVSYLLINAFVSALVTGTIIFIYDLAHRNDCRDCHAAAATLNPATSDVNVSISTVIGAGTVEEEKAVIQNNGSQPLILTGWSLKDSKGVAYTFPELTLYPGGTVQVHTRTGTDKLPDLFWGRSAPLWQSGELAALYDTQNIARAFYRVP